MKLREKNYPENSLKTRRVIILETLGYVIKTPVKLLKTPLKPIKTLEN